MQVLACARTIVRALILTRTRTCKHQVSHDYQYVRLKMFGAILRTIQSHRLEDVLKKMESHAGRCSGFKEA